MLCCNSRLHPPVRRLVEMGPLELDRTIRLADLFGTRLIQLTPKDTGQ
jgi:hypothetical protein